MKVSHIYNKSFSYILPVLALLFIGVNTWAQEVIFCESYSTNGDPKGAKTEWDIKDNGLVKVELLYNNGKTTIDFSKLHFLIEDKADPMMNSKLEVAVNQQLSWVATSHHFDRPSEYMITAYTIDNVALASQKIVIKGKTQPAGIKEVKATEILTPITEKKETPADKEKEETTPAVKHTTYSKEEVDKVHYYDNTRILFGDNYADGILANPRDKFNLKRNGVYVEMLLITQKSVNTDKLVVDVWKKSGAEYTNHVGDKSITVKSGEKLNNFHYSFFEPGEYKVSLFNADNTWICSGYLTVYGE